jgi:hypothetical protein
MIKTVLTSTIVRPFSPQLTLCSPPAHPIQRRSRPSRQSRPAQLSMKWQVMRRHKRNTALGWLAATVMRSRRRMRRSGKLPEKFSPGRTRSYSRRKSYASDTEWPSQPPPVAACPHSSNRNARASNGATTKQRALSGKTCRRGSLLPIPRPSHKRAPRTPEGPQCC